MMLTEKTNGGHGVATPRPPMLSGPVTGSVLLRCHEDRRLGMALGVALLDEASVAGIVRLRLWFLGHHRLLSRSCWPRRIYRHRLSLAPMLSSAPENVAGSRLRRRCMKDCPHCLRGGRKTLEKRVWRAFPLLLTKSYPRGAWNGSRMRGFPHGVSNRCSNRENVPSEAGRPGRHPNPAGRMEDNPPRTIRTMERQQPEPHTRERPMLAISGKGME